MSTLPPTILSITGSDGTGGAGVQADIMTISALGGRAVTAITSVTVQSRSGIDSVHALPAEVVAGQVRAVVEDVHPQAIKLGLVSDADAMAAMRNYLVGCRQVVCDPGILSSHGIRLMDDAALRALALHILPETRLLILRCCEAEILLSTKITTDADMLRVARELTELGPEWVMLRGGQHSKDRITALLYGAAAQRQTDAAADHEPAPTQQFFSSYNIEGWQRHGIGGALASAVATRLAFGDDVPTAVQRAHDYLHRQVVYAVDTAQQALRPAELYNRLLNLIAAHSHSAHDVAFYADRMSITPRYLSQVTRTVVGKSPKQIIDEYLIAELRTIIGSTSLSLQEVAAQLGFSSQMQLSKFVQSRLHRTPSDLRRPGM